MKYIVKNYSDRILFARLCTYIILVNHGSAETLTIGRMIPLGTNSSPAELSTQ
jgi:hypothetical protein